MRFEVRWSNGYWKLFDTRSYSGADTFATKDQATEAAEDANRTGKWRLCNHAGWDL